MTQISTKVLDSSPLVSNSDDILSSDPISLDKLASRRYPLCDHKEPDRLGFSKLSSNVVYPIFDFISYYCLFELHHAFTF